MSEEKFEAENELEEYEPEIVDLDGEPFEVIDAICYDGQNYVALIPYKEDEDENEDVEFIILKEVEEGDEYMLATVDDEDLYNEIGEAFLEHLDGMYEDCDCDDENCDCK